MDFSPHHHKGQCQVIGKPGGKIILKSVTVKESSTTVGCFKQSLFSSLKPSFEKTLHFFGKDKSSFEDTPPSYDGDDNKKVLFSSSFGSTPAVNKIRENSCYPDSDQRRKQLSFSEKELNKITPLGDKISNCNDDGRQRARGEGKKYALVKLSCNISGSVDEVRLRGRAINPHHLVEDGLGEHNMQTNMSPLVSYHQASPRYRHQEANQQQKYLSLSSSQFYPNEMMNDYNLRRGSTAANPEQLSSLTNGNPSVATATTMAVVHPENSRRCYSTASSSNTATSKQLKKRFSTSTIVPSFIDGNNMRGHSIDKRDIHNFSVDTPKTTRPLNVNRQLSQSHIDFYNHAQFRQQHLQPLAENFPFDSSITGSHYSQPRKPTSVVELPSAPIQPQFYSANVNYRKQSNENPFSPNGFDVSQNFQPLKSSTPKEQCDGQEWITPSHKFFSTTTTFGTEPQRKSNYMADNNAFCPDEIPTRRQSSSAEIFTDQPFDGISPEGEGHNILHSPMSNSGHSSSAATTTTTDTIMPTIFNNGHSNKVAVAPQPQKQRSNRHSSNAKEEIPRFRTHVSHSPYQMNSHPSSNGITASRSGHQLNRLSSEVFVDGPPPSTPDEHTHVRVSILEDKIKSIESGLSGRNVTNSRQNPFFNAPAEAQRLMMNEIIEKDMMIGQLKARVQGLANSLERQQMEYDEEKRLTQKENADARNRYQVVKKKLQQLTEQLDACDKTKDEEINKISKELSTVKEQIRLRDQEISALKTRLAASSDNELIKLREELRTKEHINSELQDEIVSKDAKIKQLERLLGDMHNRSASTSMNTSKSCTKPESRTPQQHLRGVETLTEFDTEDDGDVFGRKDATTPTPNSKSTFSLSSMGGQGDEKISLPTSFNTLLRNHYRKTQICCELGQKLSEANAKILEGKRIDAGRLLGFITDTEGDDSEAINSEATSANSKMSVTLAERFLRKECDMLNHLEKHLSDLRINHIEACQKGPKIFAKNSDCRVQ